jgi:23S rRNA (guanosine2251-2'-O)-methyltransferase
MAPPRPPRPPARPGDKPRFSKDRGPNDRAQGEKPRFSKERGPNDRPAGETPRRSENRLSLPNREARGEGKHEPRQDRIQERAQERNGARIPPRGERGTRAPAVPAGAVWLYGTHAVAAALANPARRLRRLVITQEAQESLAAECPPPWAIPHEIADRDRIDQLLGARQGSGIVHQGVALLTDQLTAPALLDALKRPGPILVLDQISDPRNIGALMRTAQAFGAACVIAQERNAPEETGALAKVASGALELIPLLRIVNIARALIVLKSANIWVVGLDGTSPEKLNGAAFANRRVCLVLGNEGEGLRRLTRETCDEMCALGMPGGMESLNVSAAGAVALYELTRKF